MTTNTTATTEPEAQDAQLDADDLDAEVTDGTEDEGFEPDDEDAEDLEDEDGDDEEDEESDEDDPDSEDDGEDEDGEPEGEQPEASVLEAEPEGGDAEGEGDGSEDTEGGDAEGAEGTEPETEAAAEDTTPVFAILPKRGSMTPAELSTVAPFVFGMVRVAISLSSALGAHRLVPAMTRPEGWELGAEVVTRHFNDKSPCGTWRIDAVFTRGEDGKLVEQHAPEGADPQGRGGPNYAKVLVIRPFSANGREMINRVMGDGLTVSEAAMNKAFAGFVAARAAKTKADKEAKAAQAAQTAATITADAAAEQQAITAYRAEADIVKAAGESEMDALPEDKDARIALLVSGGYLEKSAEGRLIFTGEEGSNEDVADSAVAEGQAPVQPAPAPVPAAPRPHDPARNHNKNKNRNRGGRQPLQAGAQGNISRA